MIIGVVADLVPLGHDSPNEIGIFLRVDPDEEEGRLDSVRLQNVEHLRRPLRIGPVVEGERDLMLATGALMIERREFRESEIGRTEVAVRVEPRSCARRRDRVSSTLDDFSVADIGDRIGSLERFERLHRAASLG